MALQKQNQINVNNKISNTSINLIEITEDKLELILTKHIQNIERPKGIGEALAISITLLLALLTAEFGSFLGIPGYAWKVVFAIGFLVSVGYFVIVIRNRRKYKDGIDMIIKDIKNLKIDEK